MGKLFRPLRPATLAVACALAASACHKNNARPSAMCAALRAPGLGLDASQSRISHGPRALAAKYELAGNCGPGALAGSNAPPASTSHLPGEPPGTPTLPIPGVTGAKDPTKVDWNFTQYLDSGSKTASVGAVNAPAAL
ncbi:MAG TPA: hypothetical protein VII38_03570, partial [Polyangia bacterium]